MFLLCIMHSELSLAPVKVSVMRLQILLGLVSFVLFCYVLFCFNYLSPFTCVHLVVHKLEYRTHHGVKSHTKY